jgi:flagellin
MSVINSNVSALYSQGALAVNSRKMATAMEQLSTGNRINSSKDDAAGMAIGQTMTSQIRGLSMAVRNINDGINMLQTADGALTEQANMLQRMRELAVAATNSTYSVAQRGYMDTEYKALSTQIGNIASQTKWNGQVLLTAASGTATFQFQAGAFSGETISVTASAMTVTGLAYATGIGDSTVVSSVASGMVAAAAAIDGLDDAIIILSNYRANLGATMNQLSFAVDNLSNVVQNSTASRSQITDTDYAVTTTQLAKSQIIQQAATAMLAQANQQPQSVLALLK